MTLTLNKGSFYAQVNSKKKPDPMALSQLQDFPDITHKHNYTFKHLDDLPLASPYAYCRESKHMLLIKHTWDAFNTPFLHREQFLQAKELLFLAQHDWRAIHKQLSLDASKLLFIFSIARCGSTLLSKLIQSSQMVSISEPDIYLHPYFHKDPENKDILDFSTRWFYHFFAQRTSLAIKFRVEAIYILDLFYKLYPSASFVFMIRNPISWCNSWYKMNSIFIEPYEEAFASNMSQLWNQSISLICQMKKNNLPIHILPYEKLVQDPYESLYNLLPLHIRPSLCKTKINKLMSQDSQHDSPLSRTNLEKVPALPQKILKQFLDMISMKDYNTLKNLAL